MAISTQSAAPGSLGLGCRCANSFPQHCRYGMRSLPLPKSKMKIPRRVKPHHSDWFTGDRSFLIRTLLNISVEIGICFLLLRKVYCFFKGMLSITCLHAKSGFFFPLGIRRVANIQHCEIKLTQQSETVNPVGAYLFD